ncbi:putative respiratory burst oxidase homolog protein H [Prosopis cineraria]|uniref:putative respiratory burst oxidase homolog protein H n=1 Tax=Prosopis cineraria TaxID=364024 RepID=UPI00240F8FB1|nr:putative respiratory burst oxidase homolog protein H [Prosopis cineraria]
MHGMQLRSDFLSMLLMGSSQGTYLELALFCFAWMGAESKDFEGELFDALARRRNIHAENGITLDEHKVFWEDMTNKDLESRLQVFFEM